MKRLEQIKRRLELSLRSPSEYGHLMSNPEANIEHLIGLLEQSEKALQQVKEWTDDRKEAYGINVNMIVAEALRGIRG